LKKQRSLILILILSLLSIIGTTSLPQPAHGQPTSGLVCISPNLTTCPQTSFTFNATSGSTLSVNVVAQNSAATNSFDVSVKADQTILDAPADSTGYTVSSNFGVVAQVCINGIIVVSNCSPTDGAGIVHIVAGAFNSVSGSFTLFTIHYNVVATTTGTPVVYQTGCTSTSTPDGTTCVTLVNPSTGLSDPENIETADFTNLTPSANFFATPTAGPAPLTVTFNASLSRPTTATTNTIVQYNWDFGDGSTANDTTATATHTYVAGSYTPKLYVVDSGGKRSETKAGALILSLPPDFSIIASPSSQSLTTGGPPQNSTIFLKSINQFSGTISLTEKVNTTISNAPTAVLNQTSVTLSAGQTSHSTQLSLKAGPSTPAGGYTANVTAVSGSLVHSFLVNFTVTAPDFSISATPLTVTVPQGGTYGSIQVHISGVLNFNGTVALSTMESSPEILASTNPSSIKVNATNPTPPPSTLAIAVLSGSLAGSYSVTVIGTSTPIPHQHNVTITIIVPSPDFIVTTSPASLSIQAGTSTNATIIVTGIKGYTTTSTPIALTSNSSSTLGIATKPSPSSVSVTTPNGFATATLIINSTVSTPAGSYAISVRASDGTNTHTDNITVTVTAPVASVQLGAITLSTTSTNPGKAISMNVTVTNTRAGSVSITVYMNVYSGTGGNLTVDQKNITLTNTQPQIVTLTWDTSQYNPGTYHIYAGITGKQTTSINQSATVGNVALSSPASSGNDTLTSITPWIAIAEAVVIATLAVLLLMRRRRTAVV